MREGKGRRTRMRTKIRVKVPGGFTVALLPGMQIAGFDMIISNFKVPIDDDDHADDEI